jgi:hypothetical protein
MLAYRAFEEIRKEHKCQPNKNHQKSDRLTSKCTQEAKRVELNYDLIKKSLKTTYKCHQSAQDFDVAFIKKLKLDDEKEEFVKYVVMKMKTSF